MKYRKKAVSSVRFFGRVWNRPPFLKSSFAVLPLSGLSQQTSSLLCNAGAVPAGMLDCQTFFFKLV